MKEQINVFSPARFRVIMLEKHITQRKLSEKIGVSNTFISMISRGKKNPSDEYLLKLAKALDVDVHEFFSVRDTETGSNIISASEAATRVIDMVREHREYWSDDLKLYLIAEISR